MAHCIRYWYQTTQDSYTWYLHAQLVPSVAITISFAVTFSHDFSAMHGTRSCKKDQPLVEGAPLAPPIDVVLPQPQRHQQPSQNRRKLWRKLSQRPALRLLPLKPFWTQADEAGFIAYVHANKSQAGDGAKFSKEFWNGVAQEMTKHMTRGKAKTGDACKQKWVCNVCSCPCHPWSHWLASLLVQSCLLDCQMGSQKVRLEMGRHDWG